VTGDTHAGACERCQERPGVVRVEALLNRQTEDAYAGLGLEGRYTHCGQCFREVSLHWERFAIGKLNIVGRVPL
jgi:hypothetical protein